MPKPKYNAVKVRYDGYTFDSKAECQRYCELRLLERAGEIKDLQVHKKYELIPTQREKKYNGFGAVLEKSVTYEADFVYTSVRSNKTIVEDVKGVRTRDYIIKRKLMLWVHGIKITEITN